jgi:hypothetical protein
VVFSTLIAEDFYSLGFRSDLLNKALEEIPIIFLNHLALSIIFFHAGFHETKNLPKYPSPSSMNSN